MKEMPKKVVVDRKEWFRGRGDVNSRLLNTKIHFAENKCCLGFMCLQAGFNMKDIINVSTPIGRSTIPNEKPKSRSAI